LLPVATDPGRHILIVCDAPLLRLEISRVRKGARWNTVGTLAEGIVYKSPDQALTIECSNVFEVYLVVARLRLVGFYLPVEKGFSPLGEPIQLVAFGQP
jgi:hypothetical protein